VEVQAHSKDSKDWKSGFGESTLNYTLPESLIGEQPCTAMTGTRGTVASMDPQTWHYSRPNTESNNRVLFSAVFNDVANLPVQPEGTTPRPSYIVSQPMEQNIWKRKPGLLQDQPTHFMKAINTKGCGARPLKFHVSPQPDTELTHQ